MASAAPIVKIENVSKTFVVPGRAPVKALQNVTNRVERGEVLVLIGPSGSGKSTLLRALNGLEQVDSGHIIIDDVEITDSKTNMNNVRREVGMVFQQFNLFQHKTALENVTLPQIVVLKRTRADAEEKANQLLERVGIAAKLDIITISRRLGHSKASITLDVYGHLFTENDTAAADAIDAIF